ncbi:MAG: ATP-binding cassette domain-containing protein [Lachnospiraceae bacterium]|nr:ATP-binding cassette domain-containing protein [Lachnospiraceae bacterium]
MVNCQKSATAQRRKMHFREDWKLISRAVRILNKMFPNFWFSEIAYLLLESLVPYFGLFMSSLMVNELAGKCDLNRLLVIAAIAVGGGFFISLSYKLLQSKQNVKNAFLFQRHEAFLFTEQNKLQYEHLENPDIVSARFRNLENMSTFNAGICAVKVAFSKIIANILNIIFSVSLTVTMFTTTAHGEYNGILGFINSTASVIIILALIAINTVFSIIISVRKTDIDNEASIELAEINSRHRTYNHRWGSDMITFNLNRIVLEEYRKHLLHPEWIAKVEKATIQYNILSLLLNAIQTIVIFLFTAAKAFVGAFGIGNFILYQGTIDRFVKAVSCFATDIGKLLHNNRYLVQLYDFLDLPNNMYKGTLAVEKREDIDYEIEFRDVSFQYPRTDTWALRHVNLKFKIGDKLAIVGENGSGKTTFIKLLCRLYDPTEGKILLNGIDITRYRYHEYIALFSVVFQDYTLFGFPLGENVAANFNYDEAKVRDCLIRAGLGDKLKSLDNEHVAPEKNALNRSIGRQYDSEGIDFSGGELQKIALARALYKNAPFVILDEPTAALDPIAEAAVYENFNILVKDKTAVFISHRLSSCRFCDEIAVFDRGCLVQCGSHDSLVRDEAGKYSQLWHAQAKYYAKSNNH